MESFYRFAVIFTFFSLVLSQYPASAQEAAATDAEDQHAHHEVDAAHHAAHSAPSLAAVPDNISVDHSSHLHQAENRGSLADTLAQTPLGFFSGWGNYMPRTHCLMTADGRPDWPWIIALVVLTTTVIVGYLRIFFFWRRAYLREEAADRNRKMMQLAYIFLFCAVCGYGFAVVMYVWPAYRLLACFMVLLNVFTWKFAYNLSDFGISLSARRLERQLAETLSQRDAQLQTLIASLPDLIFYKDVDGVFLDCNDSLAELLGLTRDEIVGSTDHDLFPKDIADAFRADDLRAQCEGQHTVEEWVDSPNAGRIKLHTSKRAMRNAEGQLLGVACVSRDITAQYQQQQLLEEAKTTAESANEAKSTFLANMSHEIRTPLTGVLGFAELLMSQPDADVDSRQDWSRTIYNSAKHLQTLLNDVLDISKIEAGKMEIERRPMKPHALLADLTSIFRPVAMSNGLTLELSCPRPLPSTIISDETRLRQVLSNLISNALKFTETGGIRIEADLVEPIVEDEHGGVARIKAGHRLRIDVVDTGPGISPENQKGLFQRFSQADNSVSRVHGGTGLGLVIARFFCEALGGDLQMESREGFGTRMIVHIDPGALDGVALIHADEAIAQSPKHVRLPVTKPSTPAAAPRACRGRILVVDDGPTNRKFVRVVLESVGYEVDTAPDGRAGVDQALASEPYDVILMDMQMPVLDGYSATQELCAAGSTTPIIALTASALLGDRERCITAGCREYLSKPIDRALLLSTIEQYLPSDSLIRSTLAEEDPNMEPLVEDYVRELQAMLNEMKTCLGEGQLEKLAGLAHRVVGTGGTMGFDQLSDVSRRLEHLAIADRADECRQVIEELQELQRGIVAAHPAVMPKASSDNASTDPQSHSER